MKFFNWLFHKNKASNAIAMLPWETIVEIMYDKQLDYTDGIELVKVIYSKDRSMRYVILKDEKGFFRYELETIYPIAEEDWECICMLKDALPASWDIVRVEGVSFFGGVEDLLSGMYAEPEYKQYF